MPRRTSQDPPWEQRLVTDAQLRTARPPAHVLMPWLHRAWAVITPDPRLEMGVFFEQPTFNMKAAITPQLLLLQVGNTTACSPVGDDWAGRYEDLHLLLHDWWWTLAEPARVLLSALIVEQPSRR